VGFPNNFFFICARFEPKQIKFFFDFYLF